MKHLLKMLLIGISISAIISCEKSEFEGAPPGKFDQGAFILNEGTFGTSNSSVSFLSFSQDTVSNEIFSSENQRPLGDVLQSMFTDEETGYLVVNGSNKVEVVNKADFKEKGTIEGLNQPRYLTVANEKAYISQWGEEGSVAVADLSTYTVSKTINTGAGTEGVILAGGKVWAANGGGFGLDSTIAIINPATDEVENTITVGYNPKEMVVDKNGDIWVLCYGHVQYNPDWSIGAEFASKLVKVSTESQAVEIEITIGESLHPQHLDINPSGNKIYFGAGFGFAGIFEVNIDNIASSQLDAIIDGYFYGFNVNPANGDIYACEAPNFTDPGAVHIYSNDGTFIKEYTTGIGPNGAGF